MNLTPASEAPKKLKPDTLVLVCCPNWNGKEFEYSGQPNDQFNDLVDSYIPLSELL